MEGLPQRNFWLHRDHDEHWTVSCTHCHVQQTVQFLGDALDWIRDHTLMHDEKSMARAKKKEATP